MIRRVMPWLAILCALCMPTIALGQRQTRTSLSASPLGAALVAPMHLTLTQAEQIAIRNHPQLQQAQFTAAAAAQVPTEVASVYYPNVSGNFTGVLAEPDSRIAAGALNNPIIYDRYSNGLEVSQLVTDFGRTHNLVASAHLQARAAQAGAQVTRAGVLLGVDNAYFGALRAQAILRVAQQTTQERQLVANQVSALTANKLKSGLDLSFAQVNLSQAQLLLTSAQNDLQSSYADLAMALGYTDQQSFDLADEAPGDFSLPDIQEAMNTAFGNRPEVDQQQYNIDAAKRFASAERDLYFPTLDLDGTAGYTPFHRDQLTDRYAAAGFNLRLPIFEGHLFGARRAEADLRAKSQVQGLLVLKNRIARDVRAAWLSADTSYQNLNLTSQLVAQADKALNLAQERYKLGLSSIVELSQAQLNDAQAQIQAVTARYDYHASISQLRYQEGLLK